MFAGLIAAIWKRFRDIPKESWSETVMESITCLCLAFVDTFAHVFPELLLSELKHQGLITVKLSMPYPTC